MSRKLLIHKFDMLSSVTNNMNAAFTSVSTNVEQTDKVSVHIKWASTGPTGTFNVQARSGTLDTDWYDLSFATAITVVGTDQEIQVVLQETPFREIRIVWAPTNAISATCKAILTAKAVGA